MDALGRPAAGGLGRRHSRRRRIGRTAAVLLAVCALGSTASAAAADVSQVHYTFTGTGSVAFDWVGGATDLRYGKTAAYGSTATAHPGTPAPTDSAGPFQEADLIGLDPGATYHYSIGGGPDHTFATAPSGGFRFDVEADIGTASSYPNVAITQQAIAADSPAFVLAAGDLSYASNGGSFNATKVATHFNDVMPWSVGAAYMPAWGNHEWPEPGSSSPPDDLGNYKGRFELPHAQDSAGPPTGSGEDWSWFDAGGVRFISYPEPYSNKTWSDWQKQADPVFAAAQGDASIRYIVTFGHRPAYSTGSHLGDSTLAGLLNTLGDTYSKYVLNLNGHSHDYERFYPSHHVTHVTAAGGGAGLEPPWKAADADGHPRAMHLEHVRVDVDSAGLHLEAVCGPSTSADDMSCVQGSVIDSYTIGPPVVTLGAPAAGAYTGDSTPDFSGTAAKAADHQDAGAVTVSVYSGAAAAGTAVQTLSAPVQADGTWSATPVTGLPDGTYTAEARQTSAGGTGVSSDNTFTVDTVKPGSAASAPAYSGSRTMTVAYTAADNSGGAGLAAVELWVQKPGDPVYTYAGSDTAPGAHGSIAATVPDAAPDGPYRFYTVAVDKAGNAEDPPAVPDATTILDTAAPQTTLQGFKAGWQPAPFAVTLAADDGAGSGVATTYYLVNQQATAPAKGDPGWQTYSPGAAITLHDGDRLHYYSTDNTANSEDVHDSPAAQVDGDPPSSSATSPVTADRRTFTVSYAADDANGSGVTEVDLYARAPGDAGYALVMSDSRPIGSFAYTIPDGSGDGTYAFYTLATDAAGNREAPPSQPDATTDVSLVTPDVEAPVTTDDVTATWRAAPARVTLTASDSGGSGVAATYYATDGSSPKGSGGGPAAGAHRYDPADKPTLSNGQRIRYYSVDRAGNAEDVRTSPAARVDTAAPSSTAASPAQAGSSTFAVSYTASDALGSGVARIDLYVKRPGDDRFTLAATRMNPGTSGSFSYVATSDGAYPFYTLATDRVFNVERPPASADSVTTVSTAPPPPPPPLAVTLNVPSPQKVAAVKKRGISARVRCSYDCTFKLAVTARRRTAQALGLGPRTAKVVTLGTASGRAAAGRTTRAAIVLPRKVRRALSRAAPVRLKVHATARAPFQAPARARATVVVKR